MTYEFSEQIRAFLQEKKYLQNVSSQTITIYETSFKAFYGCENLDDIKKRVVELRERGIKPISVNTYLRHMKTFYLSQGREWKMPWLKEESTLLATLSADSIRMIINHRPSGVNQIRAQLVCFVVLDCGLRISETLNLRNKDIDLENLTIFVVGKGGKHRLVPFSQELRKRLYRNVGHDKEKYLFPTGSGGKVSVRNMERDFKALFKKAGIEGVRASPHTIRHTFAVCYLRNGGNLEFLRRCLGHSSLVTTQKYLKSLGVSDLGAVHNSLSPLSRRA